jgi:hypothetical protein
VGNLVIDRIFFSKIFGGLGERIYLYGVKRRKILPYEKIGFT